MKMKWLLPVLALALGAWSVWNVFGSSHQTASVRKDSPALARSAGGDVVSGAGIVEPFTASSGTATVPVGASVGGVVAEVVVKPGQTVKAGDLLFRLDDRAKKAELALKDAAWQVAQKQYDRLEQSPRLDTLPPLEATVKADETSLEAATDAYQRARRSGGGVSDGDVAQLYGAMARAKAVLEQDKATLELAKKGTWKPDLDVAKATAEQAKAAVEQVKADLDQLNVTAPMGGTVLQVNVRKGQTVGVDAGAALVLMGDLHEYHVRVSIDENEISRYQEGTTAYALTRGLPQHRLKLRFVRTEPYVVPKKSLTGDNAERVDTRVLEAIYAIEGDNPPVHLGQQLDVFISTAAKAN
jgi:multidrug resistance efflux pump